jgi:hypothetical protein
MEKYSCQYFFHFHPKKSPVRELNYGSIINVGVTKEENKKKRKNKRAYPKTKPVINPYHTRRYIGYAL